MEVLIYPYPEMAYFVTSFAEDDLAFGGNLQWFCLPVRWIVS